MVLNQCCLAKPLYGVALHRNVFSHFTSLFKEGGKKALWWVKVSLSAFLVPHMRPQRKALGEKKAEEVEGKKRGHQLFRNIPKRSESRANQTDMLKRSD